VVNDEIELVWSGPALRDLRAIRHHVSRSRPDAARRLGVAIRERVERLRTFPHSGRVVPEIGLDHIREIIVRPYRVVFEVREHRVLILRVLHSRRLIPEDEP